MWYDDVVSKGEKRRLRNEKSKYFAENVGGIMARYAIITREFTFEASHHLPGHQGKCRRPHGHSYRLQVSLRGPILDAPGQSNDGMVMDFEDLKQIVNTTILEYLPDSTPRGIAAQPIAS